MIFDTYYWRLELGRTARQLRRHMGQRCWRSASEASVEKSIMLGFFAIRKLTEAFQSLPDMPSSITLTTFPRNSRSLSPVQWPDIEASFELNKPKPDTLLLKVLCNQVIHSHFFSLWLCPNHTLQGIFFCSDWQKNSKIYRMGISAIVALFEQIANSHRATVSFAHIYPDHNWIIMAE